MHFSNLLTIYCGIHIWLFRFIWINFSTLLLTWQIWPKITLPQHYINYIEHCIRINPALVYVLIIENVLYTQYLYSATNYEKTENFNVLGVSNDCVGEMIRMLRQTTIVIKYIILCVSGGYFLTIIFYESVTESNRNKFQYQLLSSVLNGNEKINFIIQQQAKCW